MDYILFNKGVLPEYLNICINSILSVDKNAIIHLITDQKTQKHVYHEVSNTFQNDLNLYKKL